MGKSTTTQSTTIDGRPASYEEGQRAIQERQLAQIRRESEQMAERMKYGPQMTYQPIEETVGPDGKKTIGLRKEFQLEGPEAYIQSERERLAQEQVGAGDILQQQITQQQAKQRAALSTRGGLKGANPMLLQKYSMQEALKGMQEQGRQFQTARSELESKGQALAQDIKAKNLASLLAEVKRVEDFNLEKYKSIQEQLAAKDLAAAYRRG